MTDLEPVAPSELGGGVDRVAAAGAEEHPRGHRREVREGVGQLERRFGCEVAECRVRLDPSICAATAAAISGRPWPTFAYQRLAVASRYRLPSRSQTHTSSPRSITNSAWRTLPMSANGCHSLLSVVIRSRYNCARCARGQTWHPRTGRRGRFSAHTARVVDCPHISRTIDITPTTVAAGGPGLLRVEFD